MPKPFWKPGEHPHGLCWAHDERKLCFVNIPKCASSSMKQALIPCGFVEQNFNDHDYSRYLTFTVLRDPLARFRSAVAQMNRDRAVELTMGAVLEAMETQPGFGAAYLKPQVWFLHGSRIDVVMRCDHLTEDAAFLSMTVAHTNRSDACDIESLRTLMTPEDIGRVMKHYQRDALAYGAACELKCVS